jgi:PhzF family phenazine biosynthesis protein
MRLHTLDVFGATPGSGNPALVIEQDGLDTAARQAYARERGLTCVFLDAAAASVDFFYPHTRSPLCVHATLAAAAVLFTQTAGAGARLAVTTALTGQRIDLLRDGDVFYAGLQPQHAPALDEAALGAAIAALGTTAAAATSPRVASVGSPKLLVDVGDVDVLYGLAPDLAALAAWSRTNGVNGVYAYCRRGDGDGDGDGDGEYEGRNFNHLEPHLEDSATGVAAGALTALLGHGVTLRQGRATGRDCRIDTRIADGVIHVGGTVAA